MGSAKGVSAPTPRVVALAVMVSTRGMHARVAPPWSRPSTAEGRRCRRSQGSLLRATGVKGLLPLTTGYLRSVLKPITKISKTDGLFLLAVPCEVADQFFVGHWARLVVALA